jgi:cytochrome c oxidase subunit 3
MSTHSKHVAHHFDSAEQQYESAQMGMWLFLTTEILFFGGLFLGYSIYRGQYPEAFAEASHHLNIWLGGFNTIVLLTSSLTAALAVHAAQTGERKKTVQFLAYTLGLGLVFLAVKAVEYTLKFQEHLVPGPNFHVEHLPAHLLMGNVQLFFSFYFAMTGMHALHMVIGMGILIVLIILAAKGNYSAEYNTPVELFGLYWHFVDIVWVFLFPMLYLIG